MTIRLVLADDHVTFVRTLATLLAGAGLDVVGTASNGDEAVEQCLELQPDVVLMDVNMPGTDGIAATRRVVDAAPHIGVIVLTMFEDEDSLVAALREGARGYLVKGARHDEIVRAIQTVHHGGVVVGPAVARRLSGIVGAAARPSPAAALAGCTPREMEVLDALARGHDNQAIARHLHLGEKTVRNYVSTIFTKLDVSSRAEAVAKARDAGLGTD